MVAEEFHNEIVNLYGANGSVICVAFCFILT